MAPRTGGIPWIAILDGEGTELVSSDGPNGNVGCPITESERAHFVSMIEMTIQRAPRERVVEIADSSGCFRKQTRLNRTALTVSTVGSRLVIKNLDPVSATASCKVAQVV